MYPARNIFTNSISSRSIGPDGLYVIVGVVMVQPTYWSSSASKFRTMWNTNLIAPGLVLLASDDKVCRGQHWSTVGYHCSTSASRKRHRPMTGKIKSDPAEAKDFLERVTVLPAKVQPANAPWLWRSGCAYSPSFEFGSYVGQPGTGQVERPRKRALR